MRYTVLVFEKTDFILELVEETLIEIYIFKAMIMDCILKN